ncbi:MAG: hypothetical protein E7294_11250 [Lachnospiraceae bacterium]|jgi:hypothetical protein|nr:hypothetical protein [Lachnospiraceae bacterium]
MIKIEQPWEKRNLGVRSAEYRFESNDATGDIPKELTEGTPYDYIQCRIPAGRMDLVYCLQKEQFRFAETSLDLSADLRRLQLPKIYQTFEKELDYYKIDDREAVYERIRQGIFDTDRIYLDPAFQKEQSGIRYANWCRQEVEAGTTQVYEVFCKENKIGFFALKEHSAKEADSLLAGLYEKQTAMGWGFAVLYYPMLQAKLEGKRRIVTTVSSNNPDSVRMHLRLGYEIRNLNYILIRHNR